MLGAAVPEAPVDEHRDLLGREHDVRTAAKLGDRAAMLEEPKALAMQ
jgi:hypothetical protein